MFDFFDLQRFAEEVTEETKSAEATAEESVQTSAEENETENEPVPEELEGLSEEVARETMAEAAKLAEPKEKEELPTAKDEQQDDESIIKTGSIPYARWAQKLDENNKLKAEIEEYKKKLNAAQSVPQPANDAGARPATPPSQQYSTPMPQIDLSPEVMKQIDTIKKQEALRMSGLTQEDLDGMEYMEENDPRKARYQFALKMAETNVMNRIQQAQMEQMRHAEAAVRAHNASVKAYNEFATKEMSEPDFDKVKKFATEDYFYGRTPNEQTIISSAYARVESQMATPAEVLLVQQYFTDAKAAYRQSQGKAQNASVNPMQKVNEAKSFPRAQQVKGSSDNETDVSIGTLEQMLKERPWDEIPPEYQKMLMGT